MLNLGFILDIIDDRVNEGKSSCLWRTAYYDIDAIIDILDIMNLKINLTLTQYLKTHQNMQAEGRYP